MADRAEATFLFLTHDELLRSCIRVIPGALALPKSTESGWAIAVEQVADQILDLVDGLAVEAPHMRSVIARGGDTATRFWGARAACAVPLQLVARGTQRKALIAASGHRHQATSMSNDMHIHTMSPRGNDPDHKGGELS